MKMKKISDILILHTLSAKRLPLDNNRSDGSPEKVKIALALRQHRKLLVRMFNAMLR